MIRKGSEIRHVDATLFGGPGELHSDILLNSDEFCGKGRLFNACVLHPGEAIGVHEHKNEFEVYHILSGSGTYNDNGSEVSVSAGDVTICRSGEKHGLINTSDSDLSFIALILFTG